MKAKSPVAAELSWAQVHAFRLGRHHLLARAPKKDLARVVGDMAGAQAQLMSAAELQVGVRAECAVQDVRASLWKHKSLVKTWLMRGTLHLIPAADLPLYTAAMSTRWIRINRSWLKLVGLSEPELLKLVAEIGAVLDSTPLTREEVIKVVGKGHSPRVLDVLKSGWGGMLKPAARNGMLCFGPSRGQSVTFVRPEKWLGSWTKVDPDAALIEVARRYLRAYGPATKLDFVRWWGNWPGVGTAAWAGLESELVHVSVEGTRTQMLARDLGEIARTRTPASVQLLPLFDPYLLGHMNRDHLYAAIHRSRVSRTAGWISAVVLEDGRVTGTWTHVVAKQTLRIKVEPFQRLAPRTLAVVRRRADSLAETLGLAQAEVQVAG
ncbi:MAG: winged helix DNA-binding domain-containing protein [Candidatus Dormibacteraceae bacterium]